MRKAAFEAQALRDLDRLSAAGGRLVGRAVKLIESCLREPFEGIGKPEPLRGRMSGHWSRRINDEHRLIYRVTDTEILIVRAYGHYED